MQRVYWDEFLKSCTKIKAKLGQFACERGRATPTSEHKKKRRTKTKVYKQMKFTGKSELNNNKSAKKQGKSIK